MDLPDQGPHVVDVHLERILNPQQDDLRMTLQLTISDIFKGGDRQNEFASFERAFRFSNVLLERPPPTLEAILKENISPNERLTDISFSASFAETIS